jgi:tetratricopeptide (TPR) repeat protein
MRQLFGAMVVVCCGLATRGPVAFQARDQTLFPQTSVPQGAAQSHIGRGYELLQKTDYQGAAREFETALASNPLLANVRFQLAVCYFALHRGDDTRRELELVRHETGDDPAVLYYLARLDLQEENAAPAVPLLERIASDPPFPDAPYYLGTAYLKLGNLSAAEKWLKKAESAIPRDWRVPDRLARVYIKAQRRAEAEKEFAASAALRQAVDEASQQGIECVQSLETRPIEEARASCQKLFDPQDPDKLTTLGLIYGKQGLHADALKAFLQAARLDPESFDIQYDLGLSYFRLRRYGEAKKPLERAVALRPGFFGSNALLGATLYLLHDDEAAFPILVRAHQLQPEDRESADLLFKVVLSLALTRYEKRAYAQSLHYLLKASELRPDSPIVQARMAEVRRLLDARPETRGGNSRH